MKSQQVKRGFEDRSDLLKQYTDSKLNYIKTANCAVNTSRSANNPPAYSNPKTLSQIMCHKRNLHPKQVNNSHSIKRKARYWSLSREKPEIANKLSERSPHH